MVRDHEQKMKIVQYNKSDKGFVIFFGHVDGRLIVVSLIYWCWIRVKKKKNIYNYLFTDALPSFRHIY